MSSTLLKKDSILLILRLFFPLLLTGFGKNSLSRRGRVMPGKRRPYGVITGLAARKATGIRKGISPMNRPPLSDKVGW